MSGIPYSLKFGTSNSDRVDSGTLNSWNPTAWTAVAYIKATGGFSRIFSKTTVSAGGVGFRFIFNTSGNTVLRVTWSRSGGNLDYSTNVLLTTGIPYFVAAVADSSLSSPNTVKIYYANLNSVLTLATMATTNDSSGTFTSVASSTVRWANGNNNNEANAFNWLYAGALFNGALSADRLVRIMKTIKQQQRDAIVQHVFGSNGTGNVIDITGNGNVGVRTGAIPTNDNLPILTS